MRSDVKQKTKFGKMKTNLNQTDQSVPLFLLIKHLKTCQTFLY